MSDIPARWEGGRTDTKARAAEQSRERWKESARGGEDSKQPLAQNRGEEWVEKKMHKSGISSRPPGTNNIVCWVNGSWWSQARGESDEEAGRAQPVALLLSANPQPWHDCRERLRDWFILFIYFISSFSDCRVLCSRAMLADRIRTCCFLWLNTVCDVEPPPPAASEAATLPVATGCARAMVLAERLSITQMRGCDWMEG